MNILKTFSVMSPQSISLCLSRDRNDMVKQFKSLKELDKYLGKKRHNNRGEKTTQKKG